MTLILTFIIIYIFAMYQFFFLNDGKDLADDGNGASLANNVKFLIHKGLPQGTAEDFMEGTISTFRIFYDLLFFVCILLVLNILKGITIDTFVELRKELEERLEDTTEKCFICGIDKNTFNRTLDRDAFEQHTKVDQNLWAYIYFIIYIWEQDKDDDDGLESFVRNCIENDDLFWFPMRKAIRLAEHQEKGDVHSLKYRFRRDLVGTESAVGSKMSSFKDQLSRTIGRVEKSIEYEPEAGTKARSRPRSIMGSVAGSQFQSQMQSQLQSQMSQSLQSRGGSPTASSDAPVSARLSLVIPQIQVGGQGGQYKDNASRSTAYEADKAGQMTVWVNSVVGMQASEAHLAHLQVRIKTAFDNHTYRPDGVKNHSVEQVEGYLVRQQSSDLEVKNVQARSPKHLKHTNSTFSSSFLSVAQLYREHEQRTGRLPLPTLMTFNEIENPRSLAHQGPLPTNALGNYVLRVQMVYAPPGLPAKFLGGVSVPVIELLNRAAIGQTLEVPFLPRPFDTTLPDQTLLTTSVESAGSFNSIEETPPVPVCYVSLTAAASRDLMDEWKALTAAV
ncbi:hypothetical protein B484DRAFT_241022 [Ochromonadaceae sp. CCMP2298]|nr:hypothetical protein B484DRAFT_241022 [Ochromonadaceae sp. CCMP2298]